MHLSCKIYIFFSVSEIPLHDFCCASVERQNEIFYIYIYIWVSFRENEKWLYMGSFPRKGT